MDPIMDIQIQCHVMCKVYIDSEHPRRLLYKTWIQALSRNLESWTQMLDFSGQLLKKKMQTAAVFLCIKKSKNYDRLGS